MQQEKRSLPESHDNLRTTLQKNNAKKKNLTYETYNQTEHNLNLTSLNPIKKPLSPS